MPRLLPDSPSPRLPALRSRLRPGERPAMLASALALLIQGCASGDEPRLVVVEQAMAWGAYEVPLAARYAVQEGDELTIDVSGASGPDGFALTYGWALRGSDEYLQTGPVFNVPTSWRPGSHRLDLVLASPGSPDGAPFAFPFTVEIANVAPAIVGFHHLDAPTDPGDPARIDVDVDDPGLDPLVVTFTAGEGGASDVIYYRTGPGPGRRVATMTRTWGVEGRHPLQISVSDGISTTSLAASVIIGEEVVDDLTDSDGDGLPDAWEARYGLDALGAGGPADDPDTDGLSNLEEFGRGSNPVVSGAPLSPTLIAPVGGDPVLSSPVSLVASSSVDPDGDPVEYEFEIFANPSLTDRMDGGAGVVADAFGLASFEVLAELVEDATYWWRARAADPRVPGRWSAVGSFRFDATNAPPDPPRPLAPFSVIDSLRPEFVIRNGADRDDRVDGYEFQVATDTGFSELLATATDVPENRSGETSWIPDSPLPSHAGYAWRARAVDATGQFSPWSDALEFRFSATNRPPPAPVLVAPTAGSVVEAYPVLVVIDDIADPDGDALRFLLQFAPENAPDDVIEWTADAATDGRTTVAVDLPSTGVWLYSVIADDGAASSEPVFSSFDLRPPNAPPGMAVPLSPARDETVTTLQPTFSARAASDPNEEDELAYAFEIYAGDVGGDPIVVAFDVRSEGGGVVQFTPPDRLPNRARYAWRVQARDEDSAAGPWSEPASFLIAAGNTPPGAPAVLSPDRTCLPPESPVSLEVRNAIDLDGDALTYEIRLYSDEGLATEVDGASALEPGRSGVTRLLLPDGLPQGRYWWRARVNDGEADGDWSVAADFCVEIPDLSGSGADGGGGGEGGGDGGGCAVARTGSGAGLSWLLLAALFGTTRPPRARGRRASRRLGAGVLASALLATAGCDDAPQTSEQALRREQAAEAEETFRVPSVLLPTGLGATVLTSDYDSPLVARAPAGGLLGVWREGSSGRILALDLPTAGVQLRTAPRVLFQNIEARGPVALIPSLDPASVHGFALIAPVDVDGLEGPEPFGFRALWLLPNGQPARTLSTTVVPGAFASTNVRLAGAMSESSLLVAAIPDSGAVEPRLWLSLVDATGAVGGAAEIPLPAGFLVTLRADIAVASAADRFVVAIAGAGAETASDLLLYQVLVGTGSIDAVLSIDFDIGLATDHASLAAAVPAGPTDTATFVVATGGDGLVGIEVDPLASSARPHPFDAEGPVSTDLALASLGAELSLAYGVLDSESDFVIDHRSFTFAEIPASSFPVSNFSRWQPLTSGRAEFGMAALPGNSVLDTAVLHLAYPSGDPDSTQVAFDVVTPIGVVRDAAASAVGLEQHLLAMTSMGPGGDAVALLAQSKSAGGDDGILGVITEAAAGPSVVSSATEDFRSSDLLDVAIAYAPGDGTAGSQPTWASCGLVLRADLGARAIPRCVLRSAFGVPARFAVDFQADIVTATDVAVAAHEDLIYVYTRRQIDTGGGSFANVLHEEVWDSSGLPVDSTGDAGVLLPGSIDSGGDVVGVDAEMRPSGVPLLLVEQEDGTRNLITRVGAGDFSDNIGSVGTGALDAADMTVQPISSRAEENAVVAWIEGSSLFAYRWELTTGAEGPLGTIPPGNYAGHRVAVASRDGEVLIVAAAAGRIVALRGGDTGPGFSGFEELSLIPPSGSISSLAVAPTPIGFVVGFGLDDGSPVQFQTVQSARTGRLPLRFAIRGNRSSLEGEAISLDGSATISIGAPPAECISGWRWSWDAGDGAGFVIGTSTFTHQWDRAGTWTVRALVDVPLQPHCGSAYWQGDVTVSNVAPSVLRLSVLDPPVVVNEEFALRAEVTDPGQGPIQFEWEIAGAPPIATSAWGEAGSIRASEIVTSFASVGPVDVLLRARDGDPTLPGTRTVEQVLRLTVQEGAVPIETDTDGDGIDDDWEERFGLDASDSADADEDPDADGWTNAEEFHLGNNPRLSNAPGAPAPEGPGEGEVLTEAPVDLVWTNAVDRDRDALTYDLALYGNEEATELIEEARDLPEGVVLTEYRVSASLEDDRSYCWRVRARDERASGPWAPLRCFRMNATNADPGVPAPVSPFSVSRLATPDFTASVPADPDGDSVTIEFSVAADEAFDEIVGEGAVDAAAGAPVVLWRPEQAFPEFPDYFWRVRATDDWGAASEWSVVATYRVDDQNAAPSPLTILSPARDAIVAAAVPSFLLEGAEDPDGDPVRIVARMAPESNLSEVTEVSIDRPDEVRFVLALPAVEPGVWRIGLVATDGDADSTAVSTRITLRPPNLPPPAPRPTAPIGGERVETLRPELTAEPVQDPEGDEVTYDVELFTTGSSFERVASVFDLIPGSDGAVRIPTPIELANRASWGWRILARDALGGESAWSEVAEFSTDAANTLPGAPTLLSPMNTVLMAGSAIVLEFRNAIDLDGDRLLYAVQLARDQDFTDIADQAEDLAAGGRGVTRYGLLNELPVGTYWWRARAKDVDGFGEWSVTATFRVLEDLPRESDGSEGDENMDNGGCGCTWRGAQRTSGAGLLLAVAGLLALSRRRLAVLALLLAAAGIAGSPSEAVAQTDEDRQEAAFALADEAGRRFEVGDFDGAISLLDEAYATYPAPDFLFNKAIVLERAGRFEESLAVLQENEAAILVVVTPEDFSTFEDDLIARIEMLREQREPEGPTGPAVEEEGSPLATVGWILTGVGVVAVGGGAVFDLINKGDTDEIEEISGMSDATQDDLDRYDELVDAVDGRKPLIIGLYAGGAVLAVTGVTLAILGSGGSESDEDEPVEPVTWAPWLLPGGGGVVLSWSH